MRGLIVLCILAIGSIVNAQYPESYYGPPLPMDGCVDIEAYVTEFHDMESYSTPDSTGLVFWLGSLCVEGNVAALEFDVMAWRTCNPPAFGAPGDPEVCMAWYVMDVQLDRHVMPWDPELAPDRGFYQSVVYDGELFIYDSLTYNGNETATFVQGAWEIDNIWFIEADSRSRWTMLVSPATTQVVGITRQAGLRIR